MNVALIEIEKISEDQFDQLVEEKLTGLYCPKARTLATVFRNSTNPESLHTITFASLNTDELGAQAPSLLRVIASPDDKTAIGVVKYVIAPYHRIPEIHRWIQSGFLVRETSLDDVLNLPDREQWIGSNAWAAIHADDNYFSGIGKDEIKLRIPKNVTLTNSPLSSWFFGRVLPQLT